MTMAKGNGTFIYGDKATDAFAVTWELTAGEMLTNKGSWRADIVIDLRDNEERARETSVKILRALGRKFVFKLKTDDGAIYPCGIYSLEDFSEYGVGIYPLEICSRNQFMVRLE